MKKAGRLLFSMKFAIGLLLVLIAACVLGSVIPQGNTLAWYTAEYHERAAGAIMLFGLDDVFHAPWFVVLAVLLCISLLGCNLIRFPSLIRRMRENLTLQNAVSRAGQQPIGLTEDPEKLFTSLGFRRVRSGVTSSEPACECRYAVKNKAGIWGAWLCHLGMLIVIVGFGLGQMFKTEWTVYGVPGQTRQVGDTVYALTIDDFTTSLRPDDTVEQYTSTLTMTDTSTGESRSGQASVNHPLSLFGRKLYQNSTGWAATVRILKAGEVIQEAVICAGEYLVIEDLPDLVVTLSAFYPDVVEGADGRPATASGVVRNPGYLYRLYYKEQVLGMNLLKGDEEITVEDYAIRFSDPQQYTLIQIKRDPFTGIAAAGGLLILVSLLLAFYLRTAELWAVNIGDGTWQVFGSCPKGAQEFIQNVRRNC
ncbi:MAG: cytochrome c biogenesis protein ResB [Blautia sp.]|nr:cytochrome c biogenesis protein ResB [Blautia sp.]